MRRRRSLRIGRRPAGGGPRTRDVAVRRLDAHEITRSERNDARAIQLATRGSRHAKCHRAMPVKAPVDLSIVIVSFNARGDLERCLDSLHDAAPSRSHEIIVVDNASADGSADAARQRPGVVLIETGGNLGFSRGTNVGIRASRGDALLLLNSDTIVPAGAIDALLTTLDSHPDVAVVGPRLIEASGRA